MKKLILLLALTCNLSLAQAADAHPAVWSVKGQHNTVYLVGTMHYLPPSEALPAVITDAYNDAEKLLMEIDMDDMDPMESQQAMLTLGMLPENENLHDILGSRIYTELQHHTEQLGIPIEMLDHFQPWMVAITLQQMKLTQLGLDAASGTEQQLLSRARRDHKEIKGLETLTEQLNLFANLSQDKQREFLQYTLSNMDSAATELQQMLTAWRNGDTAALAQLLQKELGQHPALYTSLTSSRNQRWLATLENILEHSSENYLVAVGSLHLVGKNSVVDLLEKDGYKPERE